MNCKRTQVSLLTEAFKAIVQGGALESRAIPKFGELNDEQLEALRNYLADRSRGMDAASHAAAAGIDQRRLNRRDASQ